MAEGILEITDSNFQTEVLQSSQPVLVDFWAPWCGPCLRLAPTIEEIAGEFSGRVRVGKLNTDDNTVTPSQYNIQGIPTVILFKAASRSTGKSAWCRKTSSSLFSITTPDRS